MDGKSLNLTQEKLERLRSVLPEAFAEDKLDWEKLRAALSESKFTEFKDERYVLNWAGKSEAFLKLQEQSSSTLRPYRKEAVNFDKTEHLFIEGENLEVLKVLQRAYFGKVKMIYIDPPYNTGNDFIYNDKFAEDRENYLQRIGDKDENGFKVNGNLIRNTKESGHFHSNWLSMMYPRLYLARNLLREDGVIFVSIDDNEVHNLRLIMNEIFGEENFVETFVWESIFRPSNMSRQTRKNIEFLLCYVKSSTEVLEMIERLASSQGDASLTQNNNSIRSLQFPAGYVKVNLVDGVYSKGKYDEVILEDDLFVKANKVIKSFRLSGKFKWKQEYLDKEISKGVSLIIKTENFIPYYRKDYQLTTLRPRKLFPKDLVKDVLAASAEISSLFKENIFSYPKPTSLLRFLMKMISCANQDIILDFFSGSATTAHAVLDLNKEDGGNRKFIMVQMPEPCEKESESFKAGYKTIADIGKERIRRVIQKIKKENKDKAGAKSTTKQDLGFKVFKLQDSNFKQWKTKIKDAHQLAEQLKLHVDPVKKGSKTENILYELLLKSGLELTAKIQREAKVYIINDGEFALLLESAAPEDIKTAIKAKPQKVIALDRLFNGGDRKDQLKSNTRIKMKDAEIEFETL